MSNQTYPPVAFALALVAMAVMVFASIGQEQASAAPVAAVTPVAATLPIGGGTTALVKFYDSQALTADSQNCLDLREFRVVDIEYVVDQTVIAAGIGTDGPNTTTLTLEHTNGAGASLAVNTTGQTVVSANSADADGLNRYDLYAAYTCVDIDVANSNPVTWTVWAVARR